MHASNESVAPARICASASFRLVGDLVRIVAAVRPWRSRHPRLPRASRIERRKDVLDPIAAEQPIDGAAAAPRAGPARPAPRTPPASHRPRPRRTARPADRQTRDDATRWVAMRQGDAIGRVEPFAGQRAIGAKLARQPRQEPGRADIGEKSDADLGHGEAKAVAGDAVRAVDRDADAAAHRRSRRSARRRACDSA